MTKSLLFAVCALACVALSGCTSLPGMGGGAGGQDWAKAALEIAKDPACTHSDVLDIMLGPVPSGHVHLERSGCKTGKPAPTAPKATDAPVIPQAPATP